MKRGIAAPDNYHFSDIPSLIAAAHELKAPLVLIRQLALELEDAQLRPTERQQAVERVRLTAERSFRLVDQLAKTARLEDALFETEPLNLRELYEDVAHQVQPLARALQQQVRLSLPGSGPAVVGNRDLVRNILFSLCDNALMYNAPGRPVLLLAQREAGQAVRLGVRDHGPRLSADAFRDLHRRLGVAAQPLGGRPRSSGLGLLIADTFARHMSSRLGVIRHRQHGLTFHFGLPVSRQLSLLDGVM